MITGYTHSHNTLSTLKLDEILVPRSKFFTGNILSCGLNGNGQLGDGTIVSKSTPVPLSVNYGDWSYIKPNSFFYLVHAVNDDGNIWGWGDNQSLNLGNGVSGGDYANPTLCYPATNDWLEVSSGWAHSVALRRDGTVLTCGKNLGNGALGTTDVSATSFTAVTYSSQDWTKINAGSYHNIGIKTDGTMWGFGKNWYGELGTSVPGGNGSYVSPVAVQGGGTWKMVRGGEYISAAIKSDNTLWTFGLNTVGQLGVGSFGTVSYQSPVQVAGGGEWSTVSVCGTSIIAIKTDGTMWSWGQNANRNLGVGDIGSIASPTQVVGGGTNWKKVSVSYNIAAAIKTDGTLWFSGNNDSGAFGNGNTTSSTSFVQSGSATHWRDCMAGRGFFAGLITNQF